MIQTNKPSTIVLALHVKPASAYCGSNRSIFEDYPLFYNIRKLLANHQVNLINIYQRHNLLILDD